MSKIKLYHHKTGGGAEYLTDRFIVCPDGSNEGVFEGANFIVRIDGDITKDAELTVRDALIHFAPDLLEALKTLREDMRMLVEGEWDGSEKGAEASMEIADKAILKAEGR